MAIFTRLETDLCKRTLANLEFITKAQEEGEKVYETTQLFISLLGIIVNVKESKNKPDRTDLFSSLNDIKINKGIREEWKIPVDCEEESIGDLIHKMRNSIAHIDIMFANQESSEIDSIIFYLYNDNKETRLDESTRRKIIFPIEDLKIFLYKLCTYVRVHGEEIPD